MCQTFAAQFAYIFFTWVERRLINNILCVDIFANVDGSIFFQNLHGILESHVHAYNSNQQQNQLWVCLNKASLATSLSDSLGAS